jgi:hypothetical protein
VLSREFGVGGEQEAGSARAIAATSLSLEALLTPSRTSHTRASHTHTQVTDPTGALLHENRGQTKGQFAFTAKSAGEHAACFTVSGECVSP